MHGFTPAQEIAYIDSAKAALDANTFPRLKLWMFFDENEHGSSTGKNFRVGYDDNGANDPTKANRYYAYANDPRFQGSYQAPPPLTDNSPLTVSLTSPASGDTVNGTINVTGTVAGPSKATSVAVLVDGATAATGTAATDGSISLPLDTSQLSPSSHTVELQAFNASNLGFHSAPAMVVVSAGDADTTAPTVPTNVKVVLNASKQVSITWAVSSDDVGVTSYTVYRNGFPVQVTADSSYVDTSAVQGATYQYSVLATDGAGSTSSASTPVSFTVPDTTPPTTPTNLKATPGTASATISWSASTDNVGVKGYYVNRNGMRVATVTNGTTFTDTGLTTGTQYNYFVVAFDAAGNKSPAPPVVYVKPK